VDRRVVAAAGAADTVFLARQTPVPRMGFGAMQLPGPGVWGPVHDRNAALTILSCPSAGGREVPSRGRFAGQVGWLANRSVSPSSRGPGQASAGRSRRTPSRPADVLIGLSLNTVSQLATAHRTRPGIR
jgi:hypothetical protein